MEEIETEEALVEAMIAHAVKAGQLRIWAKGNPDAARGLLLSADYHSRQAATCAGMICEEAGRELLALASPHPADNGQ